MLTRSCHICDERKQTMDESADCTCPFCVACLNGHVRNDDYTWRCARGPRRFYWNGGTREVAVVQR